MRARSFREIHKERNPIAEPAPYDSGAGNRRRARTFSQVIADSARGIDAGMNRFTPQRPDLSSDRYAPDWHGHYLGKQDDARSFREQEHTKMDIDLIKMACAANPAAAARTFNKSELYSVIESIAAQTRQPHESAFQAKDRVQKAERAIMEAYSMASAAPVQKSTPPISPEEFRKTMAPGHDVISKVDRLARDISHKEGISVAKAKDLAWQRNPHLRAQYDDARRVHSP